MEAQPALQRFLDVLSGCAGRLTADYYASPRSILSDTPPRCGSYPWTGAARGRFSKDGVIQRRSVAEVGRPMGSSSSFNPPTTATPICGSFAATILSPP